MSTTFLWGDLIVKSCKIFKKQIKYCKKVQKIVKKYKKIKNF